MPRKRMIDPNFWQSEDVSKLSILARLLFIGMFSNADDEGRGRANPAYLKSTVFPYDDGVRVAEVDKALSEISSNTSVALYDHDGSRYFAFINWTKWQCVQHPTKSILPAPHEPLMNDSRNTHEALTPSISKVSLREDNPPIVPQGDDQGESLTVQMAQGTEKSVNHSTTLDDRFSQFWQAYPKKVGKAIALKAFKKIHPSEDLHKKMLATIEAEKKTSQWQREGGQYIPHPTTWLNQGRWDDEVQPDKQMEHGREVSYNVEEFANLSMSRLLREDKDK